MPSYEWERSFAEIRPSKSVKLVRDFCAQLYRRLKLEQPDAEYKIHVIEGDILHADLGISAEDRQKLEAEVSVVFHLAATISFNEPLRLVLLPLVA